jgi:hypothetical protein
MELTTHIVFFGGEEKVLPVITYRNQMLRLPIVWLAWTCVTCDDVESVTFEEFRNRSV